MRFLTLSLAILLLSPMAFGAGYKAKIVFSKLYNIQIVGEDYFLVGKIQSLNGGLWDDELSTITFKGNRDCFALANTSLALSRSFQINAQNLTNYPGEAIELHNIVACSM